MHEGDHGLLDHEHRRSSFWTRLIAAVIAVGAVVAFILWRLVK